jgi:hypothetical protein
VNQSNQSAEKCLACHLTALLTKSSTCLRESGQCNRKLSPSGIVEIAFICSLPTRRASVFKSKCLRSRDTTTSWRSAHQNWHVVAGLLFGGRAECTSRIMQVGPWISRRFRPHLFCSSTARRTFSFEDQEQQRQFAKSDHTIFY